MINGKPHVYIQGPGVVHVKSKDIVQSDNFKNNVKLARKSLIIKRRK